MLDQPANDLTERSQAQVSPYHHVNFLSQYMDRSKYHVRPNRS